VTRTVADVVIIGAGIVGCSAALHLGRDKNARVIVVEKGSLAAGMTKRSGALVHTSFAHTPEARLASASLRQFQNWQELTGASCGFTKTGCITIAGENSAAHLRAQVAMQQSHGIDTKAISPDELHDLQAGVKVIDCTQAAFDANAGYVDPIQATQTLAARAKEFGVVFKTGTQVTQIRANAGRVAGVATTTGDIDTLAVIVAAGPWTDRMLKPLGVQIGIENARAQVAFFDRPPELKTGHAAFIDWTTGAHFRPHPFGLTMASLNAPQNAEPNPDRFDENVSVEFANDLRQRIAARLPALANARYLRGHAGIYDMTSNGRPVIGRVPGITGLVVAAGFSGHGFALAPAVGACLAEIVLDGETRNIDLDELGMEHQRAK
jgi:glycine/D-amino acid oxidase-like deaminating enzyme